MDGQMASFFKKLTPLARNNSRSDKTHKCVANEGPENQLNGASD